MSLGPFVILGIEEAESGEAWMKRMAVSLLLARTALVMTCAMMACCHQSVQGSPPSAEEDCQSLEQLASKADVLGESDILAPDVVDSDISLKMNPGARLVYRRIIHRIRHMRLRPAEAAPAEECIPNTIVVVVKSEGGIDDLRAAGLLLTEFPGHDPQQNRPYYEGSIDPARLGRLASIPHVRSIDLAPEGVW